MKKWLISATLLSLTGCGTILDRDKDNELPEGITLIEQRSELTSEVPIPYTKYRLDNGLTVILHEDKSDPLVHVDVTYHVGSAREDIGKSGFAHFFEHMMFQGSEHVADQDYFRLITESGGTLNGTTNRDRTNYFQTVPANQLEKVLWLESDRMGFLLNAVSQKKFEIQRSTVKNERAERYENRPYGLVYEKMGEALYPKNHPYSWQTIGYIEDLNRVDVNDLKAFFLLWYGPNNATLTIGGDLDSSKTLAWIQRYFGSIPVGPEVTADAKQPVTHLTSDRFITLEDKIQQPMLMMAWPTQYRGADDEAALDMFADVLGSGTNSLLHQALVKTGKVVEAAAYQDCAELACNLYVYAIGESGDKGQLTSIRDDVFNVLNAFEQQGVEQSSVDEWQGRGESSAIFGLQSVKGKVSQLAAYETFFDNPNRLNVELERLRLVTPTDIQQVFKRYIYNKPSVSLSVVPKGKLALAAAESNFAVAPRTLPTYQKIMDDELVLREAPITFDRSIMPEALEPVEVSMPDFYQQEWVNGLKVIGTWSEETPTIDFQLILPAGRRYESQNGLAALTASMMNEASIENSAEILAAKLDRLGSRIHFDTGLYSTTVSVSSLTKHLPETIAILQERLTAPAFKVDDFTRIQKQAIENTLYEHQRPNWLAGQAIREVLFKGTVFETPPEGTKASLSNITLEDVKAFYRQHYTPARSHLVVVGEVAENQLNKALAFLTKWQGEQKPSLVSKPFPVLIGSTIWLVDQPNAPQSVVSLVRQSLPYQATGEQFEMQLANFNLGGNFNSRINQNLREDKGYTYGAGSYQVGGKELGMSVVTAQVRADATLASLKELMDEMSQLTETGLTDEEIAFMRLSIGQKEALTYETPTDKSQLLERILRYDLSANFVDQRNDIVASIDKVRLNELAKKWFNPKDYQIIVVGDAKRLKPKLESLPFPVESLQLTR